MLRIHFTVDDVARTRLAPGPAPLWEAMLSLNRLRRRGGAAVFDAWRGRARRVLPATTRMLTDLAPATGYSVDFLTPYPASTSLTVMLEQLRNTPLPRIRRDLFELCRQHRMQTLPRWTRSLLTGTTESVTQLALAAQRYFDACLAPYWTRVQAQVERDRARRCRTLLARGWQEVLATLHPSARWHGGTLEVACPFDHEIRLDGRGLLLQPSFFCWGAPTTLLDPELPPQLVYPIEHSFDWLTCETGGSHDALVTLLGRTRANVLEAIAECDCSTTELARRLELPAPTVSRQATILREANLISSQRHGQVVLHAVTPVGSFLLDGQDAPAT
ncbi:winged helix-turn-helix domain-containing protein [Micromonospora sp. NPDC049559]|uniref:ArsR/SmtB family transcription factor n=1 Tax=Micromonospora sp. NPDC049559 TaxID=3155923 RepID=UPI00342AA9A0